MFFDGMLDENNEDINYYYPTSDLGNWSRYYFLLGGENDYGRIRIQKAKFLSKMYILQELLGINNEEKCLNHWKFSRPNRIDWKYGADGVRVGFYWVLLLEMTCFWWRFNVARKKLRDKIWNAFRLIQRLEKRRQTSEWSRFANHRMVRKSKWIKPLPKSMTNSQNSEFLMRCIWFINWFGTISVHWYLEAIKPNYGEGIFKKFMINHRLFWGIDEIVTSFYAIFNGRIVSGNSERSTPKLWWLLNRKSRIFQRRKYKSLWNG